MEGAFFLFVILATVGSLASEYVKAIDEGLFEPNHDNLQDIYVPKGISPL